MSIRKFERADIPKKVEWINNPKNNRYLHYDFPITIAGTQRWYDSHVQDSSRHDAVIEVDGIPVGIIGLLNIDEKNSKAEYYIALGEHSCKGKGVAKEASELILHFGFEELELNRIYLFTESENIAAQRLFERIGFKREGLIRQDIANRGEFVDRVMFGILKSEFASGGGLLKCIAVLAGPKHAA